MSTQKNSKQGFTLIELMVVIVIIGILAAIAIPKLFGMTEKARASEVGPAAGTWSKLQAAFMMESYNGLPGRGFAAIGYTPPGDITGTGATLQGKTNVFTYTSTGTLDTLDVTSDETWTATSTAGALKSCGATAATWTANLVAGALDKPVAGGTHSTISACLALTPRFNDLR
jgi:prepilin-type N-terminal cleavage/methylation domain-containing protein